MKMSEKAEKLNLRKWIQITMFAFVSGDPAGGVINLRDHQFLYRGMPKNPNLLTGVYGAVSRNDALFLADEYARKHEKVMYSADLWYRIDDISRTRNQIDRTIMDETGFAHLGGLSTAMRNELQGHWLKWISKDVMPAHLPMIENMDFESLVSNYPQYITKMFEMFPKLLMLVHPVYSIMDVDGSQQTINVATVRIIPDRIMHYAVRFTDTIKAEI